MRYSCNLRGECEEDYQGVYATLDACRQGCQGLDRAFDRDIIFDFILSYNPEQALDLAPSDKRELIRRLTGVRLDEHYNPSYLNDILPAVLHSNWIILYNAGLFNDYLEERLDDFDFFLLKVLNRTFRARIKPFLNWNGVRENIDHGIRLLFQERDGIFEEVLVEDIRPTSVAELKLELVQLIASIITNEVTENIPNGVNTIIEEHWDFLTARYGEMPYQRLVR